MTILKYLNPFLIFFVLTASLNAHVAEEELNYSGPITLKLKVSLFNETADIFEPFENNYIFVNTIKKSDQNKGSNQYLKTDPNGFAELILPTTAEGARFTIYKVSKTTSSIRIMCKLARVNGEYINYITVPKVTDAEPVRYDLILRGSACMER